MFLIKPSAVLFLSVMSVVSSLAASFVNLIGTEERAMMAAVNRGDLSYVTTELKRGSLEGKKVDYVDYKGHSLLQRASARGHNQAILPLTPQSLEKLAKVASTQMIDYALKQWNDNQNQVVTASDLLLRSTQHQPSWFKALTEGVTLETEDGRSLDGWALLTQNHQVELEEGRFKRAARSFAKQARKNGANFIGYANTTTLTFSGLVGF
ncbi:MAG: hypothetical protein K0M45_04690 [Candidatus Paracaedibacteraceae bacterium]|nr:hypothetical protein [Candidatus Paracaedibacteraceae bacterium]